MRNRTIARPAALTMFQCASQNALIRVMRAILLLCLLAPLQLLGQGTCPTGANYINPANPTGSLVTLSSLGVTGCYYFSKSSGSDSNSGTDETHPQAHLPGMPSYTGSITPAAGIGLILKGGDTWTTTDFDFEFEFSGTSSHPIYIGVDLTWFSGGSWTRPVWTCGGATCSDTSGKFGTFYSFNGSNYILDDIEMTGQFWDSTHALNYFGIYGNNNYFERIYAHGWTHDPTADDTANVFQPNTCCGGGLNNTFLFDVVDGSDTDQQSIAAFFHDPAVVAYSVIKYVSNGIEGTTNSVHDNFFGPMNLSYQAGAHQNAIQQSGPTGSVTNTTIYNNVITGIGNAGIVKLWTMQNASNSSLQTYVFNNVLYNNTAGNDVDICQLGTNCGTHTFFNNTFNCGGNCSSFTGSGPTTVLNWKNNHCITPSACLSGMGSNVTLTQTTNLIQTVSTASGQGYTSGSTYAFEPTSGTGSTVGAGTNSQGVCTAINSFDTIAGAACKNDTGYACTYNSTAHTVSCPARTTNARPLSTAWDIGAYNYPGAPPASAPTFSPTPGSYGSAQTVTISTTTSGATICYTSDGSTPTANGAGTCTHGTTYTTPVSVSVTTTLKAIASKSGFSDSTVAGATYTINGAASAPTFSPVAGSYGPTQSVSLSTATTGATICYTTDGSTPTADGAGTCTHGTTYSTAISVASSETIKAIASKSGWNDSSVASAAYVINGPASTPTFSPVAGSYGSAQSVTISSSTAGATLCYTTNGSTPSASSPGVCAVGSTQYTGAVTVSTSLTLKAIATKAGWSSSSVGSAAYVINGAAATPTFSPTSLSSPGWVTISSTTPGASCFYTTDGTAPTTSSTPYTHTLYVAQSQTLKAICSAPTYANSAVGSQVYSFTTKTRFSLTTTSSSVNPVPFPQDNRACCGSNVAALNPSSGTFDFTVLHNWITQSTSNGSTFTYTIQGFPTWMTGLGATESAPPSDLHTSASCAATGTTTTDCSMKSFVIALMKDRTGLSSQPANPTTCSHLDYLEIINEFNTDSPSGSSTGWTGTYSDLATLGNDISTITHAWCSNTVVIAGSASGIVGFHSNGENAHYDVALETLLQDWAGISGASLPDAISMHIYPSRQSVVPTPMPTTIVSNSSSSCTSGNTPNTSCYIAVKDEVNQLNSTATLQNTNIVHWAKSLPIYSTEGGFGEVAQLGGTSTTTIGASYVAESMMAIAAQNPINHLFYAANDSTWGCYWDCGSGTSAWLFAFNQMNTWLNGHTITGTLTSAPVTGGNRWSLQLDSGAAELDFCDAWLASCTVSTSFSAQTNLSGVTSATGGSVTLTQEPILLFSNSAVSTPTFSPVAGTYTSVQSVTISTTTTGATLCYTTDGSTPTANGAGTCTHGTTYTVPVSVATSETLKAVGSKSGSLDSPVGSAAYVINLPAVGATVSGTVVISGSVGIQ